MEHASSSPFLLSDVCDSHDVSCIKTSTSVGGLSNLLSALETSETPSEKTTETLICNEPEATEAPKAPEASEAPDVGMNEVDKESEEKEKTPMFENIWASPEGSNGDNRVRTFPQRKPKVVNAPTLKELQDEPTDVGTSDVRKSEPTPVSDPSTPNKSESELVAFWNSAVAVVSTQNFENLWGNRTENRVRKYSPQRPRTVISTSKALLPVVHRNALSPPPSLRLKALPPEMFSLQEGEEEEEKEIEAKTPKRTFESPTRRTRDRTPTTSMFSSQIVSNTLSYTLLYLL